MNTYFAGRSLWLGHSLALDLPHLFPLLLSPSSYVYRYRTSDWGWQPTIQERKQHSRRSSQTRASRIFCQQSPRLRIIRRISSKTSYTPYPTTAHSQSPTHSSPAYKAFSTSSILRAHHDPSAFRTSQESRQEDTHDKAHT